MSLSYDAEEAISASLWCKVLNFDIIVSTFVSKSPLLDTRKEKREAMETYGLLGPQSSLTFNLIIS